MTLTIDIDEQTREWLEREARMSGKTVEEIAAELVKAPAQNTTSTPRPNLGFAAGWGIWVSDDFDATLEVPMTPELASALDEGIADSRAGRVITLDEQNLRHASRREQWIQAQST